MTRTASSKVEARVPPEVLFDILDTLPSRNLLLVRAVSHSFLDTVDSLLRGRLLGITRNKSRELVFESSRPADYRRNHCQTIKFARFLERTEETRGTDIARFVLPSSLPQYLLMEEDEAFSSFLLSVHIRALEEEAPPSMRTSPDPSLMFPSPPSTPSTSPGRSSPINFTFTSPAMGRPPRSLPITPASTPPRGPPSVSISISLAEALERMYRTWFENSNLSPNSSCHPLPSTASTSSSASSSITPIAATAPIIPIFPPKRRKMIARDLHTGGSGGGCALKSARINCVQVEPLPSGDYASRSYGCGAYVPNNPSHFEFHYESVDLDVGRLVVGVEEGMDKNSSKGSIVLWMSG
ncbi:hypothetical protein T439DRAFT_321127 [Meredithblackwellia eburnea MCA 4105]